MFVINAKIRKEHGKSASRRLRLKNKLPAVVYGGKRGPISIELEQDAINNIEINPEFYSQNISMIIEGKKMKIKIQAIQHHPFKSKLIHIDFIYI